MTDQTQEPLLCVRCGLPVVINRARYYDVFEKMHWLCFHLEYEHQGDADGPCQDDTACPWWQIEVFRKKLEELGQDPEEVIQQAYLAS